MTVRENKKNSESASLPIPQWNDNISIAIWERQAHVRAERCQSTSLRPAIATHTKPKIETPKTGKGPYGIPQLSVRRCAFRNFRSRGFSWFFEFFFFSGTVTFTFLYYSESGFPGRYLLLSHSRSSATDKKRQGNIWPEWALKMKGRVIFYAKAKNQCSRWYNLVVDLLGKYKVRPNNISVPCECN